MLVSAGLRDFSVSRLRWLLAALFVALSVPTAALTWQAWSQLKWEAFYQYRGMAEELSARIDAELAERITVAEGRSFGDFAFLIVSGDPSANLLQRSPLAEYPVAQDLPGVIGYFQVDAAGAFTTPLLPPAGSAVKLGIPADELAVRRQLAARIGSVLADNRLLHHRSVQTAGMSSSSEEDSVVAYASPGKSNERSGARMDDAERGMAQAQAEPQSEAEAAGRHVLRDYDYSQQAFDQLNSPSASAAGTLENTDNGEKRPAKERPAQDEYVKLTDLKLDAALEKKSEIAKGKSAADGPSTAAPGVTSVAANRVRRLEQSALPESLAPVEETLTAKPATVAEPVSAPITTFASEIDPYEFSLLDSGHLVLFRKVWRDGERLNQGILLDTGTFLSDAIEKQYRATSLSGMSDLIVAYQDDILRSMRGGQSTRYPVSSGELSGTLLYRGNLSAPFDRLDLLFSVNRLPAGPGARVLLWTSIVIALVFVTGFLVLYRLGLSQIQLARQQQDFVSAVSHELKTPLTSIRMYGEMLLQGWVSEDKRKQYYAYIHDESERLSRLISNVLQLAKITRNEPQFELQPKSVAELLNQIESKIGNQVERAGFTLVIKRDGMIEHVSVSVDADSFAQIMINLVDNAIKFSKHAENRTIEISSHHSASGSTTFSVRDYGPGIASDQMKKIFQLFYRTESELTRETVGTGIGLAIVHQLALAMNGRVDVINRNPGAEFRLTFLSTHAIGS